MGYVGQLGLHSLQGFVEKKATDWFSDFISKDIDPYRTKTAIGDMGTLKLSDRIVFRVKPGQAYGHPILLREASYSVYKSSMWFAPRPDFKTVTPEADGATWKLGQRSSSDKVITVSAPLRKGKGMLTLPNGATEIAQLPVLKMVRNRFGAVKVEEGPGLISYQVRANPIASFDSPPNERDGMVPEKELPAINEIVRRLELTSRRPQEALKRVKAFFHDNFKYSLVLNSPMDRPKTLDGFLVRSRAGHCEYFATATVLLLRAAGIPARYATGYSVQEFSRMEDQYIVRARHAHSWALAYIEGTWRDIDTTPASWVNIEAEAATLWEPLYDLWSWGMFKVSEWRWREKEGGITKYIGWLVIPLILFLAWRFYSRTQVRRLKREKEKTRRVDVAPGSSSEFYLIEKRLIELGYSRHPWETLSSLIKRIERAQSPSVTTESLQPTLDLHYRYRFDPEGITVDEETALTSNVRSWLKGHEELLK